MPAEPEFQVGSERPRPEKLSIPEKQEDARRALAIILVVIFAIEVIGAMIAVWLCSDHLEQLKDMLTLILSPTVALVGSATGFYFGTSSNHKQPSL